MYRTADEIRQRRALIVQLRALDTPEARAAAQALQEAFHHEQMHVLREPLNNSAFARHSCEGRNPVSMLSTT